MPCWRSFVADHGRLRRRHEVAGARAPSLRRSGTTSSRSGTRPDLRLGFVVARHQAARHVGWRARVFVAVEIDHVATCRWSCSSAPPSLPASFAARASAAQAAFCHCRAVLRHLVQHRDHGVAGDAHAGRVVLPRMGFHQHRHAVTQLEVAGRKARVRHAVDKARRRVVVLRRTTCRTTAASNPACARSAMTLVRSARPALRELRRRPNAPARPGSRRRARTWRRRSTCRST